MRRIFLRRLAIATGVFLACGLADKPAMAQSSNGDIYGQVDNALKDVTVKIESPDTGFSRVAPLDSKGRFSLPALSTGTYRVSLLRDGAVIKSQDVQVKAGVGTAANFLGADGAAQLAEVKVRGAASTQIDVSTAQTSTVYSAQQLRDIPVAQDVVSVALLAPGASAGDPGFGKLPSFNGSSVAENAYYIDGFNVTNLFKNLTYSTVPFEAIASEQIIDGAYGPEYGRVTGGVMNVTTKHGTNKWTVGGSAQWEPQSLQSHSPNTSWGCTEAPDQPCGLIKYNEGNGSHETLANFWFGGPLIKNKLFIYAIGQEKWGQSTDVGNSTGSVGDVDSTRDPYYLVNLAWDITSRHRLEFTAFDDTQVSADHIYSNEYTDSSASLTSYLGTVYDTRGGKSYMAHYTSNPIDPLTFSAQWGQLISKRSQYAVAANGRYEAYNGVVGDTNQSGCPYIYDPVGATTGTCWFAIFLNSPEGQDTRRSGRADLTYKLNAGRLGAHELKLGYDADTWSTFDGQSYEGGSYFRYYDQSLTTNDGSTYTGPYVRQRIFQTGATVLVNSQAYYLADNWRPIDNLLIEAGVRNDSFKNKNGAGQVYVQQQNIWQPRLGVVWDVNGDSTSKAYASYGIYSLPLAASVAVRGASASLYTQTYYTYTAVDPTTGAPTLDTELLGPIVYNAEDGSTPNPGSVSDQNLRPIQQEQLMFGYQQQLGGPWTAGVKFLYQNLKTTIDDYCSYLPLAQWAEANGYTFNPAPDTPGCFIINPGYGADLQVDVDGNGSYENVNLSASDIGLPKAKRKLYAAELTLEKAWANKWYMNASYTYGHNYGNTEGLVRSDIGQADTGTTVDFDYPAIEDGAYGDLPNDHRHTFKFLGQYRPVKQLTVSANFTVQSGSPISCLGESPADYTADLGYGPGVGTYGTGAYNYCGASVPTGPRGRPIPGRAPEGGAVVPRGSVGHTDTYWSLDLSGVYKPSFVPNLSLTATVFNVFNNHAVLSVDQTGEIGPPDYSQVYSLAGNEYLAPTAYQTPRYVRLGARYDFTF